MQAGAGQTNITPLIGTSLAGYFEERKAADVRDEFFARAIVLDDGSTKFAFVICDLIVVTRDTVCAARDIVERTTGIPQEHVLIAATHTHSGPATAGLLGTPCADEYVSALPAKIADSVRRACARMRPVTWGVAHGHVTDMTSNRRFRMRDGSVRMGGRLDDPDNLGPTGPIDPDLSVLHLTEVGTGASVALLANFALHYVGSVPADHASPDYFGAFGEIVQRERGESFVAALANGFCADVNSIYHHRPLADPAPADPIADVAEALAAHVLGLIDGIEYRDGGTLRIAREELTIPLREITDDMRAHAKAALHGRSPHGSADGYSRDEVYARELLLLDQMAPDVRTEVQAIALDEVGFVGMPGEMFAQYGLDLAARSALAPLFKIELANDYVGYIPTLAGFEDGAYETWFARSSKLVPEAGGMLSEAAARLLGGLADSAPRS